MEARGAGDTLHTHLSFRDYACVSFASDRSHLRDFVRRNKRRSIRTIDQQRLRTRDLEHRPGRRLSPDLMIYRTRDISVMDTALSKRQNYRLSLPFQLSQKRHFRKQNSPRARYAEFEENCRLGSPPRRWDYTTFHRVHYGLTTHASVVRNLPLSLSLSLSLSFCTP